MAYAHLKNNIENNSIWDGAFYQNEWVEINSSWVIFTLLFSACINFISGRNFFNNARMEKKTLIY